MAPVSSKPKEGSTSTRTSLQLRSKKVAVPEEKKSKKGKKKSDFDISNSDISLEDLEKIYCPPNNNLSSFRPSALETIYESPSKRKSSKSNTKIFSSSECEDIVKYPLMGNIRLKRLLNFTPFDHPSKVRLKRRKNKIKAYKSGPKKAMIKVSLDMLKETLGQISDDEDQENFELLKPVKKHSEIAHVNVNSSWCSKDNVIFPDTSHDMNNLENSHMNCTNKFTASELATCMEGLSFGNEIAREKLPPVLFMDDFDIDEQLSKPKPVSKERKNRRCSGQITSESISASSYEELTESPAIDIKMLPIIINKITLHDVKEKVDCSKDFLDVDFSDSSPSKKSKRKSVEPKRRKNIKITDPDDPDFQYRKVTKNISKCSRKSRRNSGITQALYKTYFDSDSSFDTSKERSNLSNSFNSPIKSQEKTSNSEVEHKIHVGETFQNFNLICESNISNIPSATSLFSRLSINSPLSSPGTCNSRKGPVEKNSRRRSARISNIGVPSFWQNLSHNVDEEKVTGAELPAGKLKDSSLLLVKSDNNNDNLYKNLLNDSSSVFNVNIKSSKDNDSKRKQSAKSKRKSVNIVNKVKLPYDSTKIDLDTSILTGSFDNKFRVLLGKRLK